MRSVIIAGAVLCVINLFISFCLYYQARKIGFVDTIRLVNGYKFKEDLEAQEEKRLNAIKQAADSFKTLYSVMARSAHPDTGRMNSVMAQVDRLSSVFQQEYQRSNQEINEKVWTRLNPAIHEFSKAHRIELLVGANGMGTVLYGSDTRDYTEDMLKYVNSKY
ncbi:MAG: OmpH family outer membrane protein [Bacteroidetes bacterium]|nr:OmpH family outer membrane protein [Bacteroidota bacterium]